MDCSCTDCPLVVAVRSPWVGTPVLTLTDVTWLLRGVLPSASDPALVMNYWLRIFLGYARFRITHFTLEDLNSPRPYPASRPSSQIIVEAFWLVCLQGPLHLRQLF